MTTQFTCYTCGSPRVAFAECQTCVTRNQFTQLIEQQRQAEENRQYEAALAREAQEQQYQIQRQHNQRMEQLARESSIHPSTAESRGGQYIENEWTGSNSLNLKIEVAEGGNLTWTYDTPYLSPELNAAFGRGLRDSLDTVVGTPKQDLVYYAYQAGRQVAEGSLAASFTLWTDVTVAGQDIPTVIFNSRMVRTVDEEDGSVSWKWNPPFKDQEMNSAFQVGVEEILEEQNTAELKAERLAGEVVQIREQRRQAEAADAAVKRKELLSQIAFALIAFATTVAAPIWLWNTEHGFLAFVMFILSGWASVAYYYHYIDDQL